MGFRLGIALGLFLAGFLGTVVLAVHWYLFLLVIVLAVWLHRRKLHRGAAFFAIFPLQAIALVGMAIALPAGDTPGAFLYLRSIGTPTILAGLLGVAQFLVGSTLVSLAMVGSFVCSLYAVLDN